ncbi:MAG: peptidase [Gammaproteobacteria bacterium]
MLFAMTYCLAIAVNGGLILASDSRTHAGVDDIRTHGKMHTFGVNGERQFVLLSAGNLATTQAVIGQLKQDMANGSQPNLMTVSSIPEAADYVGRVSLAIQEKFSTDRGVFEASFIIGGQVGAERPKIRQIYPEGNHIGCSKESPFLQIGESKYGKPILDRIIERELTLEMAGSCALVSMESTVRSNLSVGPPIDFIVYEKDSFSLERRYRFEEHSEFLQQLNKNWERGLKAAFKTLPPVSWGPTWDAEGEITDDSG